MVRVTREKYVYDKDGRLIHCERRVIETKEYAGVNMDNYREIISITKRNESHKKPV